MISKPAESALDLIGQTPMIKVNHFDTGCCELYLKLESQNPAGSIKDRIGLSMIEAAEKSGQLKPGGTLIEATAGNTGLGLALVAALKGYRLLLVIPDKMSADKISHLKAFGADVVLTRSDVGKGHPDYYQDKAAAIAAEMENCFLVNQFGNEANPEAHYKTTAPEIYKQMDGKVDAIVAGVGSGGTITGLGRYFKEVSPETEIVLADPEGSVLKEAVDTGTPAEEVGSWVIEGIGEDFIPDILNLDLVSKAYTIPDKEALDVVRDLLKKEGILAGSSSGTLIAAALRYCREQTNPKRVVTFVCDTGNKYLSKAFNDYWMIEKGFLEREEIGDLRDVISRRHEDRAVVYVGPADTLAMAHDQMKQFNISQVPVMEEGKLVGMLDEMDLLFELMEDPKAFEKKVAEIMATDLDILPPNADIRALMPLFNDGKVGIIADVDQFYGLITRVDLIDYLRNKARKAS